MTVRLFSFNCLTSAFLRNYDNISNEVLDETRRHEQLLEIIEVEMGTGSIIALQEVELSFKPKLFILSTKRNYFMRDVHNGSERDNYMGPALLWPISYSVEDFEQVRAGDRIRSKFTSAYPKPERGWFSWIYDKTCNRKIAEKRDKNNAIFNTACMRWNWMLLVKLRDNHNEKSFIVATYMLHVHTGNH